MKTIEEYKIELVLKIMEDGKDLTWKYIKSLPKNDELREFICQFDPRIVYMYAYGVDKESFDNTREACKRDKKYTSYYRMYIDKNVRVKLGRD